MSKSPPMITAKALGAMPQFALAEMGEKRATAALASAGLPIHFLESTEGYIPEQALANFVENVACGLGHETLGLLWAPYLTVEDYDAWGQYVLSAPDLGTALRRAEQEMVLHSNTDRVQMVIGKHLVSYTYHFGLRAHLSYPDLALSAIAVVLSIPRHYLGSRWSPTRIEMDIRRPDHFQEIEDTFDCPVTFGHDQLRIFFPRNVLTTLRSGPKFVQDVTRQDVMRERAAGSPSSLVQAVREVLFVQLSDRSISIERAAVSFGNSVRGLQRDLSAHGTNFRELTNDVRMQRAVELLTLRDSTVSEVAHALGYSSPNNFSRAFSNHFGYPPSQIHHIRPKL